MLSLSKAGMETLKAGFQICKWQAISRVEGMVVQWESKIGLDIWSLRPKSGGHILEGTNKGESPYLGAGNVLAQTEGDQKLHVKMAWKCYLPEKQMRSLSGMWLQGRSEHRPPAGLRLLCSRAEPVHSCQPGGDRPQKPSPEKDYRRSCDHLSQSKP